MYTSEEGVTGSLLPILSDSLRLFRPGMRFLWLLTVAAGFGVECQGCPNHCFCYVWERLVKTDCSRRNLINTFLGISYRTQILDLSHNVISILHGNEFLDANLIQLREINLSHNRLHKIDKFSFNGLHLLVNLDLSHNSIEYLNPSTFSHNPNLKTLNVSFNPLGVVKGEPFLSSAPFLQVLDMAECRLRDVGALAFSDLSCLAVLNISRNHISKLQFLEGMKNLRYLDVSRNDVPCNDQTTAFLQTLIERRIQFPSICRRSHTMIPVKETNRLEVGLYQGVAENATETVQQKRSILDDVAYFFQLIPSFYAIVCGIQLGVFIGSFSTYVCLKKTNRSHANEEGIAEPMRYQHESDNLIPLNTPPGTPPSPYHSRFFPSNFSLEGT